MPKIVEQNNRALEGALARIVHLPPPVTVDDVAKAGYRVDGYDDDYTDYEEAYEDQEGPEE